MTPTDPFPGDPRGGGAVVVIPARLRARRLPDKPLADIHGEAMIVHVWRRAVAAGVGPVIVACAEAEVAAAIEAAGGRAVLTDPDLPSGTDRVEAALARLDPGRRFAEVINLQGDLPALDPALVRTVLAPIRRLGAEIGTLACATTDPADRDNPNVVKAVVSFPPAPAAPGPPPLLGRALYFTRAPAPAGDGPLYHHVGIDAFRRAALERFARLPPSPLERRERLEQLRALEAGMTVGVALVDSVPAGVDTPADLERARATLRPPRPGPPSR